MADQGKNFVVPKKAETTRTKVSKIDKEKENDNKSTKVFEARIFYYNFFESLYPSTLKGHFENQVNQPPAPKF